MPAIKTPVKYPDHSKDKISAVNLKRIAPTCSVAPCSILEYRAVDKLKNDWASVTWWEGQNVEEIY